MPDKEKIEFNKKMMGKKVAVFSRQKLPWQGVVTGVKDEFTFLVRGRDGEQEVDIFDIRDATELFNL